MIHHPVRGRLRDPEQERDLPEGEVCAVVHRHQQHPMGQRQTPASAGTGLLTASGGHDPHQRAERPHRQTGEHRYPLRPVRADHLLHTKIIDLEATPLRDNLQVSSVRYLYLPGCDLGRLGIPINTSLCRYSLIRYLSRSPSINSIRPWSRAFSQQPEVNQEVVMRMPQPAFFSSIAPASSRMWLTPITLL